MYENKVITPGAMPPYVPAPRKSGSTAGRTKTINDPELQRIRRETRARQKRRKDGPPRRWTNDPEMVKVYRQMASRASDRTVIAVALRSGRK